MPWGMASVMHRGLLILPFLAASVACESDVDKARRLATMRQGRLYAEEAVRQGDKADRLSEAGHVLELRRLIEGRRDNAPNVKVEEDSLRKLADAGASYEPVRQYSRERLARSRKEVASF